MNSFISGLKTGLHLFLDLFTKIPDFGFIGFLIGTLISIILICVTVLIAGAVVMDILGWIEYFYLGRKK